VQAATGVAFSLFLCINLANTASAVISAGSYDAFLTMARKYYQRASIEIALVFGALLVHVAVSLALAWGRKKSTPPLELRLHRYSGVLLVVFVFTHALATRGVAVFKGLHVAGEYVSFTLVNWPLLFFPYYALLFSAGACHLLIGLRLALSRFGLAHALDRKFVYLTLPLTVGLGLLGIAALGGQLRPISIPDRPAYERYAASFVPAALRPWRPRSHR
jgi:succinate dehydrogenase/fumarate reductase cytochrome b subunit